MPGMPFELDATGQTKFAMDAVNNESNKMCQYTKPWFIEFPERLSKKK